MASIRQVGSAFTKRAWLEITTRPFLVDYSGLKVRTPARELLAGQAGYRPIVLFIGAILFILMVVLPVPGGLIDIVEQVNPPGYDVLEPGTETIVDSVNQQRIYKRSSLGATRWAP